MVIAPRSVITPILSLHIDPVIAPILSLHPDPVIAPPLCHCEERSNPSAVAQRHGLPRRCAPRNDEGWSLRRTLSLPRSCRCTSILPSRPRSVIARNEAIHRRLHNDMDCHGAARLAMTRGGHCAPAMSLPRSCRCTSILSLPRSFRCTSILSLPDPVAASRPRHCAPLCHCEERSNPSAVVRGHGLPRRCAPRNDAGCGDAALARVPRSHRTPSPRGRGFHSKPQALSTTGAASVLAGKTRPMMVACK